MEENFQDMLGWERGLYHRPPSDSVGVGGGSTGTQIVPGIDVTSPDALRTCHSIIFHYISKLLRDGSPSSERLAQELVTTCTGESTDTKFLHSLYEYLLSTNNVETALRIDSSSLEDWLVKEKKDINLLWKYYSYHGRSVLAGSIMLNEATEENKNVPLDRRIECFTRAANSFEAALSNSSSATFNMNRLVGVGQVGNTQPPQPEQQMSVEDLRARINQIQEQLDVATIQKRVLTTISQSQDVNLEEAKMDALIFTLLDVSSIYNEYAAPLNLFDVVLLILETCRQRETATIATLWKSIICEEVLPCSTSFSSVVDFLTILKQGSLLEEETIVLGTDGGGTIQEFENGEWIPRLRNRVASLGKELFGKGADYTFPLDLIVRELEGLRQVYNQTRQEDDHASQPWPAQAILDAGVPFYMLLESLDSLEMNSFSAAGGVDNATQLQWLRPISELLELWVAAALSSYGSSPTMIGNLLPRSTAYSELIRAINLGLLQRLEQWKSSLEGLVGGDTVSAALVEGRLAQVEETIKKNFT